MNQTYDAIVIGAGVMGASIAYNLSQRGLKILILERQTIAVGATGASSGLVRMHYDVEVDSALAWESFHYFKNWRERIGGDCGFTRTGFLQLVKPAMNEQLRGNVAMQQRLGILTEVVTAEEVKKIAPMFKRMISILRPMSLSLVMQTQHLRRIHSSLTPRRAAQFLCRIVR